MSAKGFDFKAARAAIDARKIFQVIERNRLRDRSRFRRDLPSPKHLERVARLAYRELLFVAALEANLKARASKSDWAWLKLYRQRESYARRETLVESILGGSRTRKAKIFDLKIHLSSANNTQIFEDVVPTLPLSEAPQHYYWQPRIKPYVQPFVTDGSLPIGGLKVEFPSERFMPVSIHDYLDIWNERLFMDPIDAFVLMRCTGGEQASDSADQAVDNRSVGGKKHPRSNKAKERVNAKQQARSKKIEQQFADKRAAKRKMATKVSRLLDDDVSESDSVSDISEVSNPHDIHLAGQHASSPFFDESNIASSSAPPAHSGFVTSYDYAHDSTAQNTASASSSPSKKEGKAQNKKASYTPYVDYDDPTLADPEETKQEAWSVRYLRGDTLYWMDGSLRENLAENLYFDSSSIDLREASELSAASFNIPSSASSVYFEELPLDERRISLDDYFPTSPHSTMADSLYFSMEDIPTHAYSNTASGESWPVTEDIFFSEANLVSHETQDSFTTVSSSGSSIYFDYDSFTADEAPLTSSQTFPEEQSSCYFSEPPTALAPLADSLYYATQDSHSYQASDTAELTSAMFDTRCSSPTPAHDQNDLSIYGNPSLNIAFIQ